MAYKLPLSPVLPDYKDWPMHKLAVDREQLITDVIEMTYSGFLESGFGYEDLANVLYQERIRLRENPWKADPPREPDFWSDIKSRLLQVQDLRQEEKEADQIEQGLTRKIIAHYTNEICGNFDPSTYQFATVVTPYIFSLLLNASPRSKDRWFWQRKPSVYEKVQITGNLEKIRRLSEKGTIIITPTHFSNLDSLMIGWVIDLIGLPPFTYGAGLNLFSIKFMNYFMSRLGAYKIDRRKKNQLYLETLRNYSTLAISRGAHSLFFPGGTRSRSGKLESHLKLGLLSTAIEAQQRNFSLFPEETARKIYVVPAVINYHFVLEAKSLIDQHLERTGKELFLREEDVSFSSASMLGFIVKLLRARSEMCVSFGPVMDVFGNLVNEEGESLNHLGDPVNIRDYFISNGELTIDKQRDGEYARMLGDSIVDKFHTHNTVFSSHLLAFTAFRLLQRRYERIDLYSLLRMPWQETNLSYTYFADVVERLRTRLRELNNEGKVLLGEEFKMKTDDFIQHGLRNLGIYHQQRPLFLKGKQFLYSEDMKLLYFYHNRMEGYGLENHIS